MTSAAAAPPGKPTPDEVDLLVTAELLRLGILETPVAPPYPEPAVGPAVARAIATARRRF